MNRLGVRRRSGTAIIPVVVVAVAVMLLGIPSELRSEPLPVPEKPTQTQLQTQFDQAEGIRTAAPEKTKERAEAAKKSMKIASDMAWLVFNAGQYEEAANWFSKSAELKADSHLNARAYWEEYRRTVVVKTETALAARIEEFQNQLAIAEESKKGAIRTSIDAVEKIRYTMSYTSLSMLESLARENGDSADLIEYGKQELEILHQELAYLVNSAAAKQDIDLKNVQVASALERIAGAQAEMASFDEAEENYSTALDIRSALPEEMPERKLEDTLSDLGRMNLHNRGDLIKARDYFQQALSSMDGSAAVRQKALTDDPWTPAQKAGMTPEDLASHQASLNQSRDLSIATDTISRCTVLANLGDVAQESGDFKTALSFYERAREPVEMLPKGGYLNLFELVRAQIHARLLSDIAYLHAESGEVDLALKELNETIVLERSIGRDENTAQTLQQAASLAYDMGDNETAKHDIEQARQIFAAARRLPNVVSATDFLAILARDAGQLDAAADYAQEASELARKTGNIGAVASSARTLATNADVRTGSVVDKIGTLGLAGELFEAEGHNERALLAYKEAVKLLESVRATAASEASFADQKRNYRAYERIVRVLIKLNHPDQAFDYLNRAKSQKLHDSLQVSSLKSGDKSIQVLLDRAKGLQNELAVANKSLQNEQTKPEGERDKAKIKNLEFAAAAAQGEYLRLFERIKESELAKVHDGESKGTLSRTTQYPAGCFARSVRSPR
jgi:hypothetical protein